MRRQVATGRTPPHFPPVPDPTLFVFFARVGDLVMLTPVLRALAAAGPLELAARPWAATLLAHEEWLAATHVLAKPNLAPWQDLLLGGPRRRLGAQLADRGFGRIVVFANEHRRVRAWLDGWRGAIPVTELTLSRDRDLHVGDAFLAGLAASGLPTGDLSSATPRLTVPAAHIAAARTRLATYGQRVVAVQAGSSLTHRLFRKQVNVKGLAPAQWATLLEAAFADGSADAAVLLGSEHERREALAIHGALRPESRARVHDLTGEVPLDALPALLAACSACISVDTGPGHIAAAVGTPLLTIFGPTDPRRFRPRGPGANELLLGSAPCQFCHGGRQFQTCRANVCLTGLSDATLVQSWRRLQAQVPAAPAAGLAATQG